MNSRPTIPGILEAVPFHLEHGRQAYQWVLRLPGAELRSNFMASTITLALELGRAYVESLGTVRIAKVNGEIHANFMTPLRKPRMLVGRPLKPVSEEEFNRIWLGTFPPLRKPEVTEDGGMLLPKKGDAKP